MSKNNDFGSVARILFENATRSGVVPTAAKKDFAVQLGKMRHSSKKRGGSLGSVSFNISEFVGRELPPLTRPTKPAASTAKPIPLINIPLKPRPVAVTAANLVAPQQQPATTTTTVNSVTSANSSLRLDLPLSHKAESTKVAQSPSPSLQTAEVPTVAKRTTLATTLATALAEPPTPAPATQQPKRRVVIAEEKMEPTTNTMSSPRGTVVPSAIPTTVVPSVTASVPLQGSSSAPAKKKPMLKPVLHVPEVEVPTTASDVPSMTTGAASVTVDDWEQQRATEMAQLLEAQRLEDERLAELARLKENELLGNAWTERRRIVIDTVDKVALQNLDPFFDLNERLYFSPSWESAVKSFGDVLRLSKEKNARVPPYSVAALVRHLRKLPAEQRLGHGQQLQQLIQALPQPSLLVPLVQPLLYQRGVTAPSASATALLSNLEAVQSSSTWEEALSVLDTMSKPDDMMQTTKKNRTLTRFLVAARSNTTLDRPAKRMLVEHVIERCGGLTDALPRAVIISAARVTGGQHAKHLLSVLKKESQDEVTAAIQLACSTQEELDPLLKQFKESGLNLLHPDIACVTAEKRVDTNPAAALQIIREQHAAGIPLRAKHARAVLLAVAKMRTKEAVKEGVEILELTDFTETVHLQLRKLIPVLYELSMFQAIVDLYERSKPHVDIVTKYPNCTLLLNSALKQLGQKPLTDRDATHLVQPTDGSQGPSSATPIVPLFSTDTMLEYAKERRWEAALDVVEKLPTTVSAAQQATVTLLFNCALSAAMNQPSVVEHLYRLMGERGVEMNATTHNTVMSSLAKNDNTWERALQVFDSVPEASRDASTYSVLLALYGKQNMWMEATTAFATMKSNPLLSKPPPSVYGLAIHATHRHSWSVTLAMFQEMLKLHGTANAKEVVVTRVMKSLESNGRLVEAERLQQELSKGKKKKK